MKECPHCQKYVDSKEEDHSFICCDCDSRAEWIRHTQFSGNHPFCRIHAEMQLDFGKESDNFWEKIKPMKVDDVIK